jgi:hypothetical protein
MTVFDGDVNTEPVPRIVVTVFEMVREATTQIAGQTDVIELATAVEGVNALAMADVLTDDVLVLFEHLTGEVFQVLTDEWSSLYHKSLSGEEAMQDGVDEMHI